MPLLRTVFSRRSPLTSPYCPARFRSSIISRHVAVRALRLALNGIPVLSTPDGDGGSKAAHPPRHVGASFFHPMLTITFFVAAMWRAGRSAAKRALCSVNGDRHILHADAPAFLPYMEGQRDPGEVRRPLLTGKPVVDLFLDLVLLFAVALLNECQQACHVCLRSFADRNR